MYVDSKPVEYTTFDDMAWELFKLDWDFNTMTKNKGFFVYYKNDYPYSRYYEKAKIELRKLKIQKICSKLEI
jgi:hypothetical protein